MIVTPINCFGHHSDDVKWFEHEIPSRHCDMCSNFLESSGRAWTPSCELRMCWCLGEQAHLCISVPSPLRFSGHREICVKSANENLHFYWSEVRVI